MDPPKPHTRAFVHLAAGLFVGALLLLCQTVQAMAQDASNILVLEPEYRQAQGEHLAAYNALVAMEGRLNQAYEDLDRARDAGDEAGVERAYNLVLQLSGEQRELTLRLNEKAGELKAARSLLIRAYRQRVEELITQVSSTQDRGEREQLAAILEDANNRRLELLGEEEPETVLEPMRDITIGPTDTPRDILRKAGTLDYRAQQYEARLEGIDLRLEGLRQDLRSSRRVTDFLSDMERFGDTRLPVGAPGTQTAPPTDPGRLPPRTDSLGVETRPMTLDEMIRSLEVVREDLAERIQVIRDRADRFRVLARGGGGA